MENGRQPKAGTARLREAVREVLAMAPGFGFAEVALFENVRDLVAPFAASDADLRDAGEWNLGKGFARTRYNDEAETDEWIITARGIARQAVK